MASKASKTRYSSASKAVPAGLDFSTERRVRTPAVESLAKYQADLSRAWSAFNSGHIEEATQVLNKLCSDLEQRQTLTTKESDRVSIRLLYGSALTTLGRIHQFLGSDDEALANFKKAVNEFRKSLSNEPQATNQMYCDYGVSLFHVGNHNKAVEAFMEAEKRGILSSDANRYLGISYERMGKYKEAEQYFKAAIKQAPTDYSTHITLAKFYQTRKRVPDAVEEYRLAIDYLVGANLLDEATKVINRVVKLTKQDPQVLAVKAEILRRKRNLDDALEAVNAALKRDPKRAYALAVKGLILLDQRNDKEAASFLQKAVSLDPTMEWAQVDLAGALFNLENFPKALTVLERALELQPDNPEALFLKAKTQYRLNQAKEALHSLDQTLKLIPNDANIIAARGQVLHQLNQPQRAVKAFRRSIEIDPSLSWVHADLGAVFYSLGNYDEALKELNEALAIQPDNAGALTQKGEVLRTLGRLDDALQVLHQAVAFNPQDAHVLGLKGQVLSELGRYKDAIEILNESIKLDPTLAWVHVELSTALYNLEEYEPCLEAIDKALRIEQNGDWHFFKAHILCQIGRFNRAVKALNQSIAIEEMPERYGLKGWALQHVSPKHFKEALDSYEAAVRLAPQNLWWHKGIANGFYLLGEKTKADNKYEWVLKRAKQQMKTDTSDDMLALVGWCEFRLGKWEDAIKSFNQVLFSYPDEVATQFDMALALMCWEHYTVAANEYGRGIEIARKKHSLRCRGLVHVAYDDLKYAIDNVPTIAGKPQPQEALSLLKAVLNETSG